MLNPVVDVIIPVHSRSRPIARAVGSVLTGTEAVVRVNVIAHNIDPNIIEKNLGSYISDPRLRLLSLQDGIPSPAGPMNHGLRHATAPFITLLGSDDEFATGLIDSWLALQHSTNADVVVAKIQEVAGVIDPYPPVRMGRRTRDLHPRKDRLMYRSAPLGLVNRNYFSQLRFSEGLKSGEDLIYSLTLWFRARRIAYDLHGPSYIGHGDANDRVTHASRTLQEDFAYLDELEILPWFNRATRSDRLAIVAKLIRIHFFDALVARFNSSDELKLYHASFLALIQRLEALAPGVLFLLSIVDQAVLSELQSPELDPSRVSKLLQQKSNYRSFRVLSTRNPLYALHRQAPLRALGAGFRILLDHR